VLARIIEPSSKLDSLRVLEEAEVAPASYRTLKRRLPAYARSRSGTGSIPGRTSPTGTRNRLIALDGATKSVNRELEAKARDLAGLA
jgi:hypothetical protein